MSAISTASPSWLALRATADDDARSRRLAARLARLLPPGRLVLHDLGAGMGGMTGWLAPMLPGPQHWTLHDGDAGILDHLALDAVADDAGRPIGVACVVEDLEDLPLDAFAGAAAVTASALLDVVTRVEAARIVNACIGRRCTRAVQPLGDGCRQAGSARRPRRRDRTGLQRSSAA